VRRSPIVLTATIASTAAILAFHPHAVTVPRARASTTATTAGSGTSPRSTNAAGKRGFASTTGASGSATGDAIATHYGNAQVRVTIKNGKIATIDALQLQNNDPHSAQISSSAAPILQQEALSSQTANVDAVSGATYTSASYAQSLQSALDKLGFKAADGSVASLQVP
jgi:uncharacterized protein with FMN-binding domain